MEIIVHEGSHYGLVFNWNKLQYLSIGCDPELVRDNGESIQRVPNLKYLGGVLSGDGAIVHESNLQRIWSHSNISIQRKMLLYNSLIISKLLYELDGTQLNESEKRRLDAFRAKCLRRILKVLHSFYNHVSNSQIWQAAHTQPLTSILVRRQLKLF